VIETDVERDKSVVRSTEEGYFPLPINSSSRWRDSCKMSGVGPCRFELDQSSPSKTERAFPGFALKGVQLFDALRFDEEDACGGDVVEQSGDMDTP
jgi:hypothetical protein